MLVPPGIGEAAERCLTPIRIGGWRSVSCEYRHGVLYLRGRLSRYYHKQLAQEAVARLEGVTQVVNEIEVLTPEATDRRSSQARQLTKNNPPLAGRLRNSHTLSVE